MQSHKAYAIGQILNSRVPKLTSSGSLGGKRQSDGETENSGPNKKYDYKNVQQFLSPNVCVDDDTNYGFNFVSSYITK